MSSAPRAASDASTGIALALLAAALWGLTPVATKGALDGYSAELVSVVRLALGAVLFRGLGGPGGRWLPREPWSIVAGVGLGADFLIYNYGVRLTTAALASLVVNVEVVSTIVLAVWLLGEALTPRRVLGAAITLAGAVYVALDGVEMSDLLARDRLIGNVLVMIAGSSWSLYAVAQRRVPAPANLFRLMTPIFVVATLTTLPGLLAPSAWRNPGGAFPTFMFGVLVVLCTIAVYLVYARSQQLVDVSVLAVVLCSIPVFAVGFAHLVLGESISVRAAAGGAVIIAGVLVIATEHPAAGATPTA